MALIENIQREDLNPIEAAAAYRRLADDFGMTQQQIAEAVGKERATVANYQRLLGLPAEVQTDVAAGRLTMGHARALAGLGDAGDQLAVARRIREGDLSVRDAEALVPSAPRRRNRNPRRRHRRPTSTSVPRRSVSVSRSERASGSCNGESAGGIEISFTSENELQRLYDHLTGA